MASGGFDAGKIAEFEREGTPVDAYGVGSSLVQGANDFTADVVRLEGRDCAKAGRSLQAQPTARESQLGLMSRPRMADWGSG